ncbi:MAG: sodium:calcium antiporter, partial [Sciscionella sp.]|nr:sodium:calcium antiporter [Sciscionella sp.]
KPALALANIAGAMMIQCTVPSGLAIAFTPWRFSPALISSAIVTMLAVGYLLVISRYCQLTPRLLAAGVVFYVFFAISLVPILR